MYPFPLTTLLFSPITVWPNQRSTCSIQSNEWSVKTSNHSTKYIETQMRMQVCMTSFYNPTVLSSYHTLCCCLYLLLFYGLTLHDIYQIYKCWSFIALWLSTYHALFSYLCIPLSLSLSLVYLTPYPTGLNTIVMDSLKQKQQLIIVKRNSCDGFSCYPTDRGAY